MDSFEQLIKQDLANGRSPEEIAKAFSTILTKLEKEDKARQTLMNKRKLVEQTFRDHYEAGTLTRNDVVALAYLVEEKNHPEWTEAEIHLFMTSLEQNIEMLSSLVDKDERAMVKNIINTVADAIGINSNQDEDIVLNFLSNL